MMRRRFADGTLFLRLFQFLLEFLDLGPDDRATVALVRIVPVIILVVALALVEFGERHNFRDDGAKEILLCRGL